jgi:hypothetical protein
MMSDDEPVIVFESSQEAAKKAQEAAEKAQEASEKAQDAAEELPRGQSGAQQVMLSICVIRVHF